MWRAIFISLFLLLPTHGEDLNDPGFVAGLLLPTLSCPDHAVYLVKQGFEAVLGYDNCEVWIQNGGGTITSNYTGIVLEGIQSLRLANAGNEATTTASFVGQSEIWVYFLMQPVTIDTGAIRVIVGGNDTNGVLRATLQVNSSGKFVVAAGGAGATTTDGIANGSTYHVWIHWKAGSGADAVADVGFSTNGIRPTSGSSFAQVTDQPLTLNLGQLRLGATFQTGEYIFDHVRVSTSQIGDNPP